MEKKMILVTGANSGIGKETAMTLAKAGYYVILHGRDKEKTKRVYEEIKKGSGSQSIDMICVDLSLMNETR